MKISEMNVYQAAFTQLGPDVLAVLIRRVDGWCVYVGSVPGLDHSEEYKYVLSHGTKQKKQIAEAIVKHLFYPGFEIDLEYIL